MLTKHLKDEITIFVCDELAKELMKSDLSLSERSNSLGDHLCGTVISEVGPIEINGKTFQEAYSTGPHRVFKHCDQQATKTCSTDLMKPQT